MYIHAYLYHGYPQTPLFITTQPNKSTQPFRWSDGASTEEIPRACGRVQGTRGEALACPTPADSGLENHEQNKEQVTLERRKPRR